MTGSGNNTYLLIRDGRATLIDAGVGDERHLRAVAEHLNVAGATLEHVLVTHAHGDHISGVRPLARNHPSARFHKSPWPAQDTKYPVIWEPVAHGDRIGEGDPVTAIATPGHSPDHLAFWHEPSATVFSGDLVVLGGSVMIHVSGGGDLGQYLASLARIRDLKPSRLLPAHGPQIGDPETVLTQYIDHRLMRERQVVDAIRSGHQTVDSMVELIYPGLHRELIPAARETVLAHLEKLRGEGRVLVEESSNRWTTSSISST
jgi:glyoxylase-like metal-dependent hydrolase (beta-lactamase superfamily II)